MLDSRGLLKQIHDLEPSPTRVEMSDYDKNERFGAIDYDDMQMFNVPSNNDMDQNIIDENSIRGLEPKFVSESNPVNYQIPRSKRGLEPESVSDSDPINYQTLYDRKMPSAEPDWIKDLKERYPEIQNMTEVEISNYFGPNKIIKNLLKGRGSNLAIEPMSEE
jgi:hypothetical protein